MPPRAPQLLSAPQLSPPRFNPGGVGQPGECGRKGEVPGWETHRGSLLSLPFALEYRVFLL